MGAYRGRDLLNVPGLLSLSRVPLAVLFPFVAGRPGIALLVLGAAGASDVLDGWYARRFGQVTATGAAIDPLTDKIFVTSMVTTLLVQGALPWWAAVALAVREIGEVSLVLWVAAMRRRGRAGGGHPGANVAGKLTTVLQFGTVACAIGARGWCPVLAGMAACAGMVAAISYWRRESGRMGGGRGGVDQ